MLYYLSKLKIDKMTKRDRSTFVTLEVDICYANYFRQRYGVKTHTDAVRKALEDFSKIPDLSEALKFDHDKCLAVSEETKVRLMQAMDYPDWRFAALHIISDYLYEHNARLEMNKTENNPPMESKEENNV